jgi:hypothetical protein
VARIGSKQGIFVPCKKRGGKIFKCLKVNRKKMKNILIRQVAGVTEYAILAGIRRKASILVDKCR